MVRPDHRIHKGGTNMIFKRKIDSPFFQEDSMDQKFNSMMSWIRELSKKDYNKVKKAMDLDYDAYRTLHGIDMDETVNTLPDFMIDPKENNE